MKPTTAVQTIFCKIAITIGLLSVVSVFPDNRVKVEVALSNPVLEAYRSQTTYLKVGLTGFERVHSERVPVNLSIVLDRSGSMEGENLAKAREAAQMVVDMLEPDDIFSLIVYESTVQTLIPATRLYNKDRIREVISSIESGGSTALFGGVSKGINEVRKNLSKRRVNRVILLSDGLANVGPSSPYELAQLGKSAGKEGIAITTVGLGLGYNEDLMSQLAMSSDGNHAFAENSDDLATIFNSELGDVLSVVAQDVAITINCPEGIRPLRVVDREASIRNQTVTIFLNQLYSNQEKYVLIEVEVPSRKPGSKLAVASVDITYNNLLTNNRDDISEYAYASFSASKEEVVRSVNKVVAVQQIKAEANVQSRIAIELRDKGEVEKAKSVMASSAKKLSEQADLYESEDLRKESVQMNKDATVLDDESSWSKNRKSMRKAQYKTTNQQSY